VYICVLQCAAVCCSVLKYVAVRCSALQCVAVCCNVLQCAAVRRKWLHSKCVAFCLYCQCVTSGYKFVLYAYVNTCKSFMCVYVCIRVCMCVRMCVHIYAT